MLHSLEAEFDGKKLLVETGKYALQAGGAVTVRCGDTVVLATVCLSPEPRSDIDFLPLTVDYEERLYATGKIPGSFFRREGRPGQDAVLFGRLVDRPLRPLFPKGFHNDVQIILTILSVDRENPPEILGIIAASAALSISEVPFQGPVGASRVSHIDGRYVLNPTYSEIDEGDLAVVVAGTRDAVMMVEAASNDVAEEVVLEAIRRGQEANTRLTDLIDQLVAVVGKAKVSFEPNSSHTDLEDQISTILDGRLSHVMESVPEKVQRERSLLELEDEVRGRLGEQHSKKEVSEAFEAIQKKDMRSRILEKGIRPDGRGLTEIRPISCEIGVLPRTHGSGLFTRGETQVLSIATLAPPGMRQILDNLSPGDTRRFMHHYNFPPYSVGEVRRMGTGRREVGHGALAERALEVAMPSEEEFPYVVRLVSEVLSSNGSTSMASVCGSTLALMDAGVPVKSPVAGIAMGLVMGEDGNFAVLTDIAGMEDHLGDMDFKVAGTSRGINALQMDIKVKGITPAVMELALRQAKDARLFILDKMGQTIAAPRFEVSPYAPKMVRIMIPVSKIGVVIGPGGRVIRALQEETGASINVDDDGGVTIASSDAAMIKKAQDRIEGLTREIVVGDVFTGRVTRLTSFGAFVEILPGKDGLLRSVEADEGRDGFTMGEEITVIVVEIDHMGRINLSQRALSEKGDRPRDPSSRPPQDRPPRGGAPYGPRGGPGPQGDRGPRPGQGPGPSPGQGGNRSDTGPGPGRRFPPRPSFRGFIGR